MDKYFKTLLTILLIIITISVTYYYVFILPKIKREQIIIDNNNIKSIQEMNSVQLQMLQQQKQIEIDRLTEIYRKECISEEKQKLEELKDFLNSCSTNGDNSVEYCINSPGGKILIQGTKKSIPTCINEKRKSINI